MLWSIAITALAQKEANHWYFGADGAGLEFNNDCEVTVKNNGNFYGYEGVVTMSDKNTGELLFYCNSHFVMNSMHDTIPNSFLVAGGNTITQLCAFQKPGSESVYYIITSEVQGFSGEHLRFHALDMTMNNGLGGMLFTDSLLCDAPVTEKLCAIRHANGEDIWIVGHAYNSIDYLAFLVTQNGINTTAVVSSIGKFHGDSSYIDSVGELKASPDGSHIAAVTLYHPDIEVFDFNNSTGAITNAITIPAVAGYDDLNNPLSSLYALSFSANSNLLYASQWISQDSSAKILQYDLSSDDPNTIIASRYVVYNSSEKNVYGLKLGPDERIYVSQSPALNYLGIIHLPDVPGADCMYEDNALSLGVSHCGWGLNNLMDTENSCKDIIDHVESEGETASFTIYPNPSEFNATITFPRPLSKGSVLTIRNLAGQIVFQNNNLRGTSFQLDASQFASGLYLIEIAETGKSVQTTKWMLH